MSCYTTENERPDKGNKTISQTKGIWLRKMNSGDYELYRDGEFVVSYGNFNEHIAVNMIEAIYEYGIQVGKRQNANQMREALGFNTKGIAYE